MAITRQTQGREWGIQGYANTARASALATASLGPIAAITSNLTLSDDGGAVAYYGVGSSQFVRVKPGTPAGAFTIEMGGLSRFDELAWCVRATDGVLPWLFFAAGVTGAAEYSRYVHDAKVNRLSFRGRAGEAFSATMEGIHGLVTTGTVQVTHANVSAAPLMWDEATWGSAGTLPADITGIDFTLNNNVKAYHFIGGTSLIAARNFSRQWDALKEGLEQVEGTVSSPYSPSSFIGQANSWTEVDPTLKVTPRGGGTGFQITFNDLVINTDSVQVPEGEGDVEFTYPFQAKSITIASATA